MTRPPRIFDQSHQRALPGRRHSHGLAHLARQTPGSLDGSDSGVAASPGAGGLWGTDRHRAVRPGPERSQIVAPDPSLKPAPYWIRGRSQTPLHPAGGLGRRSTGALDHTDRPTTGSGGGELVRTALLDRNGFQSLPRTGYGGHQEPRLAVAQDPADGPGAYLPPLAGAVGGHAAGPGLRRQSGGCPGTQDRPRPAADAAPDARAGTPRPRPPARADGQRNPIRHRLARIFDQSRLLHQGRLWRRVWLLPEPWPESKPQMHITCHSPP